MKKKVSLVVTCILAAFTASLLAGCGANLDREITVQEMSLKVPSSWLESPSDGNNETKGTIHFEDVDKDKDDDETADLIVINYQRFTEAPTADSTADSSDSPEAEANETSVLSGSTLAESQENLLNSTLNTTGANSGNVGADPEENATDGERVGADQKKGSTDADADQDEETVARTALEAILAKQKNLEKEYGISGWSVDKEKSHVIDGAQVTVYEYSFVKDIDNVKHKYEFKTAYVFTTDMYFEISVFGGQADINNIVDSIEF